MRHTRSGVPSQFWMTMSSESSHREWQDLVLRVVRELAALPLDERRWIGDRLRQIRTLQEAMHAEFLAVDGATICAACTDCCCSRGRYHLTLVNLVAYLDAGEVPPETDFNVTCPWLAPQGCRFEPGRRPFNCVTFVCSAVEEQMDAEQQARFYARERELRRLYLEFDQRYAGSSLRGLLLRAERLGSTPFFAPAIPAARG